MNKKWTITEFEETIAKGLQESLHIHPAITRILAERGIRNFEEAKAFFRPDLNLLNDPWLMKDMDLAVNRILQARDRREKILVYGDYDVDGTTSIACVYDFLKKYFDSNIVDFYIPHRYREGYGISTAGIDFASGNGFQLVIALDCGIKSAGLIGYALEKGIEFIVCDHHLPDSVLPPAIAILNPKQIGCPYPYKELCGCGIGYKLIIALCHQLNLDPQVVANQYLDLVATAIAADIVPLNGENRILAYHGLKKANDRPNFGIRALAGLSGIEHEIHFHDLVFMIAPRINAAGRMDDASKAVQLFVAETPEKAQAYAKMLHSDNSDRKEADASITEEALAIIERDQYAYKNKSTVVYQPHWHKGVVGIVASRLIEKYYRPTVVLTQSGEVLSGSARSVKGFNLYEAIHECRETLLGYGGHFAAAGLTLLPEKIEAFRMKFEEVVSSRLEPHMLIPEILIDAEIHFRDIKDSFYRIILQMEPFGPENRKPVFIVRSVNESGYSRIVKERHIRFSLVQDGLTLTGIGFNMSEKFTLLLSGKPLDIVFTLDENEWNGQKKLQLKVIDMRIQTIEFNTMLPV